jgi:hypothetical protein
VRLIFEIEHDNLLIQLKYQVKLASACCRREHGAYTSLIRLLEPSDGSFQYSLRVIDYNILIIKGSYIPEIRHP